MSTAVAFHVLVSRHVRLVAKRLTSLSQTVRGGEGCAAGESGAAVAVAATSTTAGTAFAPANGSAFLELSRLQEAALHVAITVDRSLVNESSAAAMGPAHSRCGGGVCSPSPRSVEKSKAVDGI